MLYKNRAAFFTNKIYRPVAFCTLTYYYYHFLNLSQTSSIITLNSCIFRIIIIAFIKLWMYSFENVLHAVISI